MVPVSMEENTFCTRRFVETARGLRLCAVREEMLEETTQSRTETSTTIEAWWPPFTNPMKIHFCSE